MFALIFTIFLTFSNQVCEPIFWDNIEVKQSLKEIANDIKTLNKKEVDVFLIKEPQNLTNNSRYQEFLENSAEIIFTPGSTDFGHIILRLGREFYDFADVKAGALAKVFDPAKVRLFEEEAKRKSYGVAFYLPKSAMQSKREEIMNFYKSMIHYNVPGFHGNGQSGKLYLETKKTWFGFKTNQVYRSEGKFGNNEKFKAEITTKEINGREKKFLVSALGIEVPISLSRDGKMYVKGLSCASSAAYILNKTFGWDLPVYDSARNLIRHLSWGNNKGETTPIAVVDYQ